MRLIFIAVFTFYSLCALLYIHDDLKRIEQKLEHVEVK